MHDSPTQPQIGKRFQDVAEAYLRKQGFHVVQRNFRCALGEIDLIVRDRRTLVFVEVKSRASARHGSAATAVTSQKQRQISRVAVYFLKMHRALATKARFDVIAVDDTDTSPRLRWIPGAFELQYD